MFVLILMLSSNRGSLVFYNERPKVREYRMSFQCQGGPGIRKTTKISMHAPCQVIPWRA